MIKLLKLVAEKSATTFGDLPDWQTRNKGVPWDHVHSSILKEGHRTEDV